MTPATPRRAISRSVRWFVAAALLAPCVTRTARAADYPTPSVYPISWQLDFEHDIPKRIVVEVPGRDVPMAYWYLTYSVTNKTGQEQTFLPDFEMLTTDGAVIRSDRSISAKVFDAIKAREHTRRFLEPWPKISGEIRLGEDQARDGVAIWEEPTPRMGSFSIFATGLSGEAVNVKDDGGVPLKDDKGNPILLRKSLQMIYHVRGDEIHPGEDDVNVTAEKWVMR